MPPQIVDSAISKLTDGEKSLIQRVPDLESWQAVREFKAGFSGAKVILVWATYSAGFNSYQVFKFGTPIQIQQEEDNWTKYVKNSLPRKNIVHLKNSISNGNLSLIIYDCVSHKADFKSFREFYSTHNNPSEILSHLFMNILNPWFAQAQFRVEDLNNTFSLFFEETKRTLARQNMSPLIGNPLKKGIKVEEVFLPNPLHPAHLPSQSFSVVVPTGVVHGDLNADNILLNIDTALSFDGLKEVDVWDICLIDFHQTKKSNQFTDLAKLETVIKFQLLEIDDFKLLLAFENFILDRVEPTIPEHPLSFNKDKKLLKAFYTILPLRHQAGELIKRDGRCEDIGFWMYLYLFTLKSINYIDLSWRQRMYAFISASLILNKHI